MWLKLDEIISDWEVEDEGVSFCHMFIFAKEYGGTKTPSKIWDDTKILIFLQ